VLREIVTDCLAFIDALAPQIDRLDGEVRARAKAGPRGAILTALPGVGQISKQGSAWLRWVLNQAAQTAKRSPEFAATYAAIAKRRGKKIATIAIARKLLARAYHLLLADTQASQGTICGVPARRPRGVISPGCARPCGMSRPPGRDRSHD
jgi:hypothetical protein